MYLHSLKLKNYRGFRGISEEIIFHGPNGEPGSGLNILVGENNVGKSTILRAICFLHNSSFEEKNPASIAGKTTSTRSFDNSAEVGVIGEYAETSSDLMLHIIEVLIKPEDRSVVEGLLTSNSHIRCRRIWQEDSDERKISFLHEREGFNAEIRSVNSLDFWLRGMVRIHTFGWDDKFNNDEASEFNKTCRRFLRNTLQKAEKTDEYRNLKNAFNSVFRNQDSSLRHDIAEVEANITSQFQTFFGEGSLHFEFEQPTMDQLLKSLALIIDLDCPLARAEHGQGAQRIAELAVLTAWALKEADDEFLGLKIPFIFLLDEPEIYLHPRGQEKLLKALLEISRHHQVFVTTHSPLFLHSPNIRNANLLLCRKEKDTIVVQQETEFARTFDYSPTWGEINWFAYNMPTIKFHNELFSLLQELYGQDTISDVDKRLKQSFGEMNEQPAFYTWIRKTKNGDVAEPNRTLSYCVRNAIHHPENHSMGKDFVENNLKESINIMLRVIKHLRAKEEVQLAE